MSEYWPWLLFLGFVIVMMLLDLGVFHRKAHEVGFREAMIWSAVWVFLSLAFNGWVWYSHERGSEAALEYFTGYLIELSLSVDNLFVFLLIFHYFQVKGHYQHRVLFWGILGALVMRAVFIALGIALIQMFHWVIYIFGAFLIYTGVKLALEKDKKIEPEKNVVLKLFRRMMPIAPQFEEGKFFVRHAGKLIATPLFVVLIVVETTDLIFAVDSIPAILAITNDPFIVYTSNVFAILGLRSMYFALAGLMRLFHYLHYGLAIVLVFVGAKMLVAAIEVKVPIGVTLGVVVGVLTLSVLISIVFPVKTKEEGREPSPEPPPDDRTSPRPEGIQADKPLVGSDTDASLNSIQGEKAKPFSARLADIDAKIEAIGDKPDPLPPSR
jgi:tellurite resistance protein TerC